MGSLETPQAETASISIPAASAQRVDSTVVTTQGCVNHRVAAWAVAAYVPESANGPTLQRSATTTIPRAA
jgi:hypothetical protein